ncbi:MAG: hypothetical protein AAF533_26235 [Acidobacteriota bacterium]
MSRPRTLSCLLIGLLAVSFSQPTTAHEDYPWDEIVRSHSAELKSDTDLLARAIASSMNDEIVVNAILETAAERATCELSVGSVFCDYVTTLGQVAVKLEAAGCGGGLCIVENVGGFTASSSFTEDDVAQFMAMYPFKEVDGLRVDYIIRVPTLDPEFYPEGGLPTAVASAADAEGGVRAHLVGEGEVESVVVTGEQFPDHVFWATGINVPNRDMGLDDDIHTHRGPLPPCKKKPSTHQVRRSNGFRSFEQAELDGVGTHGECACRTSLPHYCGNRCFSWICWGRPW